MAELDGVNVERLEGGLARLATGTDNHIAYVAVGVPAGAVATAINNGGKGKIITSRYQAEQMGINAAFDANNSLRVYEDILEIFRLAPDCTLYLFDKVVEADFKVFIKSNPQIKGYGLHVTFSSQAPNLVTAINAQQAIINAFATENRLLDFALIGFDGLEDYTQDLHTLDAPQVSIVVACNNSAGKTAVGSALGMLAVRKVSENMASVNIITKPLQRRGTLDYPLTDGVLNKWPEAFLSNGKAVNAIDSSVLNDIIEKGFIVAAGYEGYAGVFFENSYTCTAIESDFAFIENNRTWNKAARIVRVTLLPEVKGKVKKEPSTGYIESATLFRWKTLLDKALNGMVTADEISGFEHYINPNQVVNNTNPLQVTVSVVADGIVHSFEVAIGLTNSI